MTYEDFPCQKAVTLLTEYLEAALGPEERAALERHLLVCEGCMTYFDQLRDTVRAAASLREGGAPAPVDDLLVAFRSLRGGGSHS